MLLFLRAGGVVLQLVFWETVTAVWKERRYGELGIGFYVDFCCFWGRNCVVENGLRSFFTSHGFYDFRFFSVHAIYIHKYHSS